MAARTAPLMLRSGDGRPGVVEAMPATRRSGVMRRLVAAVLAVVAGLAIATNASPAAADPGEDRLDDLFQELGQAQEAYLSAKAVVDASVARQQELIETLETADEKMAAYQEAVGIIAHREFVSSGHATVSGILSAGSADQFLDVMSISDALRTHQTNQVRALLDAVAEATALRDSIAAEVAEQEAALQEMQARKQEAENALWRVGSGAPTSGFGAAASAIAAPSPRSADGTWAPESRTVWEPAASNYITPRTAHGRDEAIRAGFQHWVSCYYGGGTGQHPLGRACDFAVEDCRFCGDVYGADKQYGTDLAAFFVFNAQRLGVLYVIWYRQIWLPSSGWRSYSGCCTASRKHTNHVHVSFY